MWNVGSLKIQHVHIVDGQIHKLEERMLILYLPQSSSLTPSLLIPSLLPSEAFCLQTEAKEGGLFFSNFTGCSLHHFAHLPLRSHGQ